MKIITFFSEKGGVGKSTFTILYASWLQYKHGKKVAVIDFDNRLKRYRADEIKERMNEGLESQIDNESLWTILDVNKKFIMSLKKENRMCPISKWIDTLIHEDETFNKQDIIIIDLPGSLQSQEIIDLIFGNKMNLVIIPIDKDPQTLFATISVKNLLEKMKNEYKKQTEIIGFINQIQFFSKKEVYDDIKNAFEKYGLKILPDMISYTERIKKIAPEGIIRTTVGYPDWSSKEFEGSRDLGIENLFIDITKEINKLDDIADTDKTDLSFINNLTKDTSDQALNRQLNGTSFPEYEIELPDIYKKRFKKNK